MSVKLAKYVFKRIRGRVIPIRIGLERATKNQNKLVDSLNKFKDADKEYRNLKSIMPRRKFIEEAKKAKSLQNKIKKSDDLVKLGSGVDFDVFTKGGIKDYVIKIKKIYGGKETVGTSNKAFTKRWPMLSDKYALNKVMADNIPNYVSIGTFQTDIIRLKKSRRGILQEFLGENRNSTPYDFSLVRESQKFRREHGLNIDAHMGNISNGALVDTGGNLLHSSVNEMTSTAKELLGVEDGFNSTLKEFYKKSTVMSDEALLSGQSPKIKRILNSLKKDGHKLVRSKNNDGEFNLVKLKKVKIKYKNRNK